MNKENGKSERPEICQHLYKQASSIFLKCFHGGAIFGYAGIYRNILIIILFADYAFKFTLSNI